MNIDTTLLRGVGVCVHGLERCRVSYPVVAYASVIVSSACYLAGVVWFVAMVPYAWFILPLFVFPTLATIIGVARTHADLRLALQSGALQAENPLRYQNARARETSCGMYVVLLLPTFALLIAGYVAPAALFFSSQTLLVLNLYIRSITPLRPRHRYRAGMPSRSAGQTRNVH
jgi:hypothetical protein